MIWSKGRRPEIGARGMTEMEKEREIVGMDMRYMIMSGKGVFLVDCDGDFLSIGKRKKEKIDVYLI